MTDVHIRVHLRPYQRKLFGDRTRFTVRLLHRRAGKSWLSCAELLTDAIQTTRKDWRGFYVCPSYRQAKAVAFDLLKGFVARIPGVGINESELRIDLPNGSRIQLLGAENYDSLRGRYADAVVLDEVAMIPTAAWTTVIAPMLADRLGRATFIGTPNGRVNLMADLWEYAGEADDPAWSRAKLTFEDTGVLAESEIRSLRRLMSEPEFEQEMLCSFDASTRGSFYGPLMAQAQDQARVTAVKHDRLAGPVQASLDLGYSDLMVAIFVQRTGTETRILKAEAYECTSIPDMVSKWRADLPFKVEAVVLPHDARVHELGTGKTREQVFKALGLRTIIAPRQSLHEGIEQVRNLLPHCWFDKDDTRMLREALGAYRSEFDEVRQVHRMTPVHDWSSHWADALRTLATGARGAATSAHDGPLPAPAWRAA
jgi:phage terminase large subunit